MTVPHYVNEHTSEIRAIKPGWYGMESNGKLSAGPFFNQQECLTRIALTRNNLASAQWNIKWTFKCPECGGEPVRPCIRIDERGWEWSDNTCERCGHKLGLEERRHLVD